MYVQYLLKDKRVVDECMMLWYPRKQQVHVSEAEMKAYNSVIPTLKEINLRDIQYKITNKILVTKSFLYRIRKIDDNLCEYCRQNSETILHLFVQCNPVKRFWRELDD